MSKQDSSSETESNDSDSETQSSKEVEVVDTEDAVVFETEPGDVNEADASAATETEAEAEAESLTIPAKKAEPKKRRSWFNLFNFLLILALAAAAGYYWWQQQQVTRNYQAAIAELEQALSSKASKTSLDNSLLPLKSGLGGLEQKIAALGVEQQGLQDSSEKLYELYGRDKNDWQLAEVEYLMRVAQHKLILQDDFEGAAITLQAASDKIGLTGDPGLLPVRVMISEEIADLKTRKRPDLVGMTLILSQLGRQTRVLEPGFAVRVEPSASVPPATEISRDWLERFNAFLDSLVKVRNEATAASEIEANNADVGETLEDNLKLARWSVLERDARQYQQLIDQSLRLFREFYDLDNAANHDFMAQLQDLQKMVLKPEKPDISGSLRELQRILKTSENAPQPVVAEPSEPGNG